jgi:hypothetical protein
MFGGKLQDATGTLTGHYILFRPLILRGLIRSRPLGRDTMGDYTALCRVESVQRQTFAEAALRSYNAGASIANMNAPSSANAIG